MPTTNTQTPQSFLELQARAEALGGIFILAARLEAVELIHNDFINLCAKILNDFRQANQLTLEAATKLLSLDAKTLTLLEKADKNYPIQTYLETIDAYHSLK